jgi:hypothetical protein
MPRISRNVIKTTFYLYKNEAEARAGRGAKGTGFVVVHRGERKDNAPPWSHVYAVTNQHVASQYPIVRLNREKGIEIFEFGPEDWEFHPEGDDIAVVPLGPPRDGRHRAFPGTLKAISTEMFVYPNEWTHGEQVGVGDDVFMIGLFVDHEGVERNNPLARFGNISMVANEDSKVIRNTQDGRRIPQLSYIVDMHSRTGFSGSPVFVYRTFASDLTSYGERVKIATQNFPRQDVDRGGRRDSSVSFEAEILTKSTLLLLGIHWGQFPERYEFSSVRPKTTEVDAPSRFAADDRYVTGYSGMTLVVPAWKILELLNLPQLRAKRDQAEALLGPRKSGAAEE